MVPTCSAPSSALRTASSSALWSDRRPPHGTPAPTNDQRSGACPGPFGTAKSGDSTRESEHRRKRSTTPSPSSSSATQKDSGASAYQTNTALPADQLGKKLALHRGTARDATARTCSASATPTDRTACPSARRARKAPQSTTTRPPNDVPSFRMPLLSDTRSFVNKNQERESTSTRETMTACLKSASCRVNAATADGALRAFGVASASSPPITLGMVGKRHGPQNRHESIDPVQTNQTRWRGNAPNWLL